MINSYRRVPDWEVEILRPDYTIPGKTQYKYVPEWGAYRYAPGSVRFISSKPSYNSFNTHFDLIGYDYSNFVNNPAGSFNLTFTTQEDNNGYTWYDKLQSRDMVKIKEFGEVRYIGLIKNIGYSSQMSSGKPERRIVVSGFSFGGLVQEFNLPMNTYLWAQGGTADSANKDLINALNSEMKEQQDLANILKQITDSYYKVVFGSQDLKGTIQLFKDFNSFNADSMLAAYPQIFSVFQVESNNLWNIYREILPHPVYEMFGRYDKGTNKYSIICRETPFDNDNWNSLPKTTIDPIYLVSQNLNFSDNEVFTHYYSSMPNSAFSENENYARAELDTVSKIDEDLLYIYGYKQLKANFKFFDTSQKESYDAKKFLKETSERMYSWFKNNRDFSSGQIVLMNVPDDNNNMIDIGERVSYLSGQFYVEGYKRSMEYPKSMKTALTVTRGYEYDSSGNQKRKIDKMGEKIFLAEKEQLSG